MQTALECFFERGNLWGNVWRKTPKSSLPKDLLFVLHSKKERLQVYYGSLRTPHYRPHVKFDKKRQFCQM